MATGQGIKEARAALAKAEKALDLARITAGEGAAPGGAPADTAVPAEAGKPPAELPPAVAATPYSNSTRRKAKSPGATSKPTASPWRLASKSGAEVWEYRTGGNPAVLPLALFFPPGAGG